MRPDCGPRNGSMNAPKNSKNVPQINKLEPKRPPKVASGEGQQHSAPEMSNNMSWPEMEPLCGGRQTYEENLCEI